MKYILPLLSLLVSSLAYAQVPNFRPCATMEVRQNNIIQNPALLETIARQEQQIQKYSQQNQVLRTTALEPVVIPVVVHVLYNTNAQNISETQIASQISALNKDYRALNPDLYRVPIEFKDVVADAEIQFVLAQRDPDGKATRGIVRVQTTKTSFSPGLQDAKYSRAGGSDAWPPESYLNIWVVPQIKEGNDSISGYASFPQDGRAADGVVIGYKYFGTFGTLDASHDLGRTATHEIGHWLGLYHTFRDGCVGDNKTTCSYKGDMVCDTPPVKEATYGCPGTQNTCNEALDQNDMTMNFMDFTDDKCMYMFTKGQKDRMWYHLNSFRSGLFSSKGSIPPVTAGLNVSLVSISGVSGTFCTGSVNPVITILNDGTTTTITTINYTYKIDNGTAIPLSWSGNLAINSSATIPLPTISGLSKGNHIIEVNITEANGQTEEIQEDNLLTKNFTIAKSQSLPYSESFENSGQLPDGWAINNLTGIAWEMSTAAASNGTYSARMSNFESPAKGQIDDLLTPIIPIGTDAVLKFDVAYKLYTAETESPNYSDTLTVLATSDCGVNYTVIYKEYGRNLTTGDPYFTTEAFVPATNEWKTKTISLSNFAGQNTRFTFRNTTDVENNLYLDNIRFEGTPTLGLNDQAASTDQISLFPNPTHGSFTVSATSNIDLIVISDLLGGEIKSINPEGTSNHSVDLGSEPSGIYIVKTSAGGLTKVTRVIVE